MTRTYEFCGEEPLEFDDSRMVRELVQCAFDQFGYEEPFGMDTVTVYQAGTPGRFIQDTSRKCSEEITDPKWLCFAYYVPDFLYYAEGGWGHHMSELHDHPVLRQPVPLILKFEDFRHTVVFDGTRSFREALELFQRVGYVDEGLSRVKVWVLTVPKPNYAIYIDLHDPVLDLPMTEFEKTLPIDGIVTLILEE